MFVIGLEPAAESGADEVNWSGRRHDDDRPDTSRGTTSASLFDSVFAALHDGEQVAIGVDASLTAAADDVVGGEEALLRRAGERAPDAGLVAITRLLDELGHWRSWTAVSTSLAGWRSTRSILVWRIDAGAPSPSAAVEAFFDLVRSGRAEIDGVSSPDPVVNLVAAAAIRAGLPVDPADLSRPVLRVSVD